MNEQCERNLTFDQLDTHQRTFNQSQQINLTQKLNHKPRAESGSSYNHNTGYEDHRRHSSLGRASQNSQEHNRAVLSHANCRQSDVRVADVDYHNRAHDSLNQMHHGYHRESSYRQEEVSHY